ncbi:MAG: Acetamidase [Chrysothrix sp. TS-e1954]|nr:MAG: Acetamidase [Chrysothrix sp. TS-e1954]
MSTDWEQAAAKKRQSTNDLIPAAWRIPNPPSNEQQRDVTGKYIQQFLDTQEIEITETDAAGIAAKTCSGSWKAVDVTKAFCHRAALAHQLTNCLLEIFFDAAISEAEKLDTHLAKTGTPVGPLHGLPISLKDQFHVRGVGTSMGYVGWVDTFEGKKGTGKEKVFESEMVKELAACGAVFYCKTSVPHTLMTAETINNIMGYAWNPRNRNLSPGGSSGGEGALIALKGSPLGFGTDIGGSIRIPAAVNGLYGIRPSAGRMPYQGMANSMDGQNSILSVVGPLAHTTESLEMVMKAILSQEPWLHDPLVAEMPWRDEQAKQLLELANSPKKLAFGVLKHDGKAGLHPPVTRALEMMSKTLEKLGHEVFEWKPPSHINLEKIAIATWLYDGGADVHKAFELSGEPPAPQVSATYGHKPRGEMTASHIAETNIAKREAQKEYLEYWNSTVEETGTGRPADAVIAPVAPFAAARPTKHVYVGYSMFVNVLDYTAVTVPVTQCDKDVDKSVEGYKPLNEQDRIMMESYDPEVYDGAPVALQLIGRRFQEEKMLALAGYVGKALQS